MGTQNRLIAQSVAHPPIQSTSRYFSWASIPACRAVYGYCYIPAGH